jgi:hypothetical protein
MAGSLAQQPKHSEVFSVGFVSVEGLVGRMVSPTCSVRVRAGGFDFSPVRLSSSDKARSCLIMSPFCNFSVSGGSPANSFNKIANIARAVTVPMTIMVIISVPGCALRRATGSRTGIVPRPRRATKVTEVGGYFYSVQRLGGRFGSQLLAPEIAAGSPAPDYLLASSFFAAFRNCPRKLVWKRPARKSSLASRRRCRGMVV